MLLGAGEPAGRQAGRALSHPEPQPCWHLWWAAVSFPYDLPGFLEV